MRLATASHMCMNKDPVHTLMQTEPHSLCDCQDLSLSAI